MDGNFESSHFQPGTYKLEPLLKNLTGSEIPSDTFSASLKDLRNVKKKEIVLPLSESDKFIRGVIHEQSAEPCRPIAEIISNSIDAITEKVQTPDISNLDVVITPDSSGGYTILVSDKGRGSGMTQEQFIQKYLPPTASTKGGGKSSSIGQMGVGAQQLASFVRRPEDTITVIATDAEKNATLYKIWKKTDTGELVATLAGGTASESKSPQGADKQGVSTRIHLSAETVKEIGFSVPAFVGYCSDRFGNYDSIGLSVSVRHPDRVSEGVQPSFFSAITPSEPYAQALAVNYQRAVRTESVTEGQKPVAITKYEITPDPMSLNPQTNVSATIDSQSNPRTPAEELAKAVELKITPARDNTCLIYLNVLKVRFGEPLILEGADLPASLDLNFNYRIGQISESRSDLRFTEYDFQRVTRVIEEVGKAAIDPQVKVKVLVALNGLCQKLDAKSPNKLRTDLNLASRLKDVARESFSGIDKGLLVPEEFASYLDPNKQRIIVPSGLVDLSGFSLEAVPGVIQNTSIAFGEGGKVYSALFPDSKHDDLFTFAEGMLLVNRKFFPNLDTENPLQQADIIRLIACSMNAHNQLADNKFKLPHQVTLIQPRDESKGLSHKPFDFERGEAEIDPKNAERIDKARQLKESWDTTSLTQKLTTLKTWFGHDYSTKSVQEFAAEMGLTSQDEINAFFTVAYDHYLEAIQRSDMHEMMGKHGENEEPVISTYSFQKQKDVGWTQVASVYEKTQYLPDHASKTYFALWERLSPQEISFLQNALVDQNGDMRMRIIARTLFYKHLEANTELKSVVASLPKERIESLFADRYPHNSIPSHFERNPEQTLRFINFALTDGINYDQRFIESMFSMTEGDMDNMQAALFLASSLGLSAEDIRNMPGRYDYLVGYESEEIKAFKLFFVEEGKLKPQRDKLLSVFNDKPPVEVGRVGDILRLHDRQPSATPASSSELIKLLHSLSQAEGILGDDHLSQRRLLQHINSVESGHGGSVHEVIKNAVQAIKRMNSENRDVIVSDFLEVEPSVAGNVKQGFGFHVEDQAGWQNAGEALFKLVVPGEGEGLHGIHFLTLLKEYDKVRVRANDIHGKCAFIEFSRDIDRVSNRVSNIGVRYLLDENLTGSKAGTVIEGIRYTDYPRAEAAVFRSSIDHFARNVPQENAHIFFQAGDEKTREAMNQQAKMIIEPTIIDGLGKVQANITSSNWYAPEITIDNTPIRFDLKHLIENADFIPSPYKKLLQESGFSIAIDTPQTPIVRSTLEFKDQVSAQVNIERYLRQNWSQMIIQMAQSGRLNIFTGDFLAKDCWYDAAIAHSRQATQFKELQTLQDDTEVGAFFYYTPMIEIESNSGERVKWSIAGIVADQLLPTENQRLSEDRIPTHIRNKITEGRQSLLSGGSEKTADYTIQTVEIPDEFKRLLANMDQLIKSHMGTSVAGVQIKTHTGRFRGFDNAAFHSPGIVSYNLDNLRGELEKAKKGDPEAMAKLLEVTAHEFEHERRGHTESPFHHTADFYDEVGKIIATIPSDHISSLV